MENPLVGKKIKSTFYMNEAEAKLFGWYCRPLVIEFEDGTVLIPQKDDEGNDGGALFFFNPETGHQELFGVHR